MSRSLLRIARRARTLDRRERLLAMRAVISLMIARLLLRTMRWTTLRRMVARIPPRSGRAAAITAAECARAVARARHVLPGTRCLARALAAEFLLRRDGHPANLSLGVALDETRRLHAHAWLESNGLIITGGSEADRYTPLAVPPPS